MRTMIRGVVPTGVKVAIAVFLAAGFLGSAEGQTGENTSVAPAPTLQGVYTGTIGGKAIVMEIGASTLKADEEPRTDDGSRHPIEGRYFYRSHRVGILLEGEVLADGSLRLKEYPAGKRSGAEWKIGFSGGRGSGTFCECDATSTAERNGLKIALTRVSKNFDGSFSRAGHEPHQAYYDPLLGVPLKIGPEVRESAEIGYVRRTDTELHASAPRIIRFPDRAVMKKVNDDLDQHFLEGRAESADASLVGGSYDWTADVTYFSRDFMTVTGGYISYYPGMMHPDYDFFVLTYDMHTGEGFDMGDFFLPPEEIKGAEGEPEEGESKDPLDRRLIWLYLKYNPEPENCDEDILRTSAIVPYFDRKGLVLRSAGMRFCGTVVIVPWVAIRDLVRKDRVFQRVLGR